MRRNRFRGEYDEGVAEPFHVELVGAEQIDHVHVALEDVERCDQSQIEASDS
jgi:hypothetical protein